MPFASPALRSHTSAAVGGVEGWGGRPTPFSTRQTRPPPSVFHAVKSDSKSPFGTIPAATAQNKDAIPRNVICNPYYVVSWLPYNYHKTFSTTEHKAIAFDEEAFAAHLRKQIDTSEGLRSHNNHGAFALRHDRRYNICT